MESKDLFRVLMGHLARFGRLSETTVARVATVFVQEILSVSGGQVPTEGETALATARLQAILENFYEFFLRERDMATVEPHDRHVRAYWTPARLEALSEELRGRVEGVLANFQVSGWDLRGKTLATEILNALMNEDAREAYTSFHEEMNAWSRENAGPIRRGRERELVEQVQDLPESVRTGLLAAIENEEGERSALPSLQRFLEEVRTANGMFAGFAFRLNGSQDFCNFDQLVVRLRAGESVSLCETLTEQSLRRRVERFERGEMRPDWDPRCAVLGTSGEVAALANREGLPALMRFLLALGVDPTRDADCVLSWTGYQGHTSVWYLYQVRDDRTILMSHDQVDRGQSHMYAVDGDMSAAAEWLASAFSRPDFGVEAPLPADPSVPRAIADAFRGARERIAEYREAQAAIDAYLAERAVSVQAS